MKIKLSLLGSLLILNLNFAALAADDFEEGKQEKARKLLEDKLEDTQQVIEVSKGWYDARLITPGTQVYLKDKEGYKLHKEASDPVALHLYKQSTNLDNVNSRSQGLLQTSSRSLGVSVDTSIHTQTVRKNETKSTYVQYDKNHIQQKNKDFSVDANAVNSKNQLKDETNYDGGHLVDHKFSAQGSHTDSPNYVPQHHFYNRWLKEYIVKNANGYLEIPFFTSNPPMIKVIGEDRYDPIPIGILLVSLMNLQIQDMYYFPNNQYNYRACQINLRIQKDIAKNMIANFRLKKAYHALLWPAIIHDIRARDSNFAHQLAQETKRIDVMGELIEGMSVLDLDEEEAIISTLASDVIHQSNVKIFNILDVSKTTFAAMNRGQNNQSALNQSFNVLGQFLVDYAMKNALKSEMLSTHSRIMFANIITDFIECHHQVSEKALERVDEAYKHIYPTTLKELWNVKEQMNLRDLIYFANLYEKLSSPHIESAFYDAGLDICDDMDLEENINSFISVLQLLCNKVNDEEVNVPQMQNLVDLFINAQIGVSYIVAHDFPPYDERSGEQRQFLREVKERVKEWDRRSNATSGEYQTSPNSGSCFKKIEDFNTQQIDYLGTLSSSMFSNG